MPRSRLEQIRECIRRKCYDMTAHAFEEMAEDLLEVGDVEHAILTGTIRRIDRSEPRGTKCVISGFASDRRTPIEVVGRLIRRDRYLIITTYEVT